MNGTINKAILIGNLGDDVKMHRFDDQNCLARFPIATSESYTTKETNERVTQTEWHNIVVRNRLAEVCDQFLSKGDKVYVEGKIKTRKWNDQGTTRYSTEIHAENIQFLTPKKGESGAPQEQQASVAPKEEAPKQEAPSESDSDDLPF